VSQLCPLRARLSKRRRAFPPPATRRAFPPPFTLPDGLSLNAATGVISGTPTTLGTSGFTAKATDTSGPVQEATKALSITVTEAPEISVTVVSVVAKDIVLGGKYNIVATIGNTGAAAVMVDVDCEVSGAGGSQTLTTETVLVPAGGTATVKFDDYSDSSLAKGTYTATVTIPEHDPIGAEDPFRIK